MTFDLKTLLRQREISVLLMLLAVAIYLAFATDYFLSQRNLMNVGRQASVVAIVALGQALVIIARGIDLSVGSVIGLSAVCSALVMQATGSDALALTAGLAAGLGAGLLNGAMVTRLHINPFIATLGMLSVARGIALLLTGGIPVPYSGWAEWLGAGRVSGIPVSVVMMFALVVIVHIAASRSVTGREVYAVGDNPKAARLAGIDIARTRMVVFAFSGLLAGLGGIILAGNLASADPNLGMGYELDVIAAVILGGTALSGGRGSIIGVLIGAMLMALLNNAFVLLSISAYWQVVTKGLIIILAVGIDGLRRGAETDD
ncbi:ABC transporter permease [Paracoccus onubensis]|uniref:ABC transporter permease n=1 Tax=Paracoccus onubensis TaxID=1675788 RepID=UPI002730E7B5|nr:ABC transporter permease [Paracoccus onubensis]MDP0928036.1 ABC transporter permease [Paracoccus onubensis]